VPNAVLWWMVVGVQMKVWRQERAITGEGENECINCCGDSVVAASSSSSSSSSSILCFVDGPSLYNLVNKTNLVQNFSQCVYFFSLHVSGDYVPIIRRNNCIYMTLGICHSET
jgi:hypothetical protein